MAHCTCINGHLMWNGDGTQIYLPYRLNFFKQFTDKNPSFILNSDQYNEIYDCYDVVKMQSKNMTVGIVMNVRQ